MQFCFTVKSKAIIKNVKINLKSHVSNDKNG